MTDDFTQLDLLPPPALEILREAKNNGFVALIKDPQSSEAVNCMICKDTGIIWLQIPKHKHPMKSAPGRPDAIVTYDHKSEGWYIVDDHVFPCSACDIMSEFIALTKAHSGLTESEWNYSTQFLSKYPNKKLAHQAMLSIISGLPKFSGIYLFYGGYGHGKSGILKTIVASSIKMGVRAQYIRSDEYLRRVKATYDNKDNSGKSEQDVFDELLSVPVLAIDEVDVISKTDWANNTLRSLLDDRYRVRDRALTVLASNSPPDDLWEYLESRVKDGIFLEVGAPDLRGN